MHRSPKGLIKVACTIINGVIIFDHLLKVVSNRFLHCKVIVLPFVIFREILWNYSDIPFLIKLSSICFGINWSFFKSTVPPKIISRQSILTNSFPFSLTYLLFIYFFISIRIHGLLFYLMGYNTTVYFDVPVLPNLASGSPLKWTPVDFFLFSWFFENFLTFWHTRMFQDHLGLLLTLHWNQPFL